MSIGLPRDFAALERLPLGFTAPKNKPAKTFATFFDFLRIYKQNRFFEEVIVLDDKRLIQKLKRGDRAALNRVMERFTPYLSTVVWNVMGSAASLTVRINASGEGVLGFAPAEALDSLELTIREIKLSPFSCTVYGSRSSDIYPNLRFRMKDGTVLTQAQMLHHVSWSASFGKSEFTYRFKQVQDLDEIAGLIVFDREYPLDGSKSVPVEHDPALDPFTVTRMEPLSEDGGYTVPVRELTEKLGGAYTWDAASRTAACTYRGVTVTLQAGSTAALIDEREVELGTAPAEQGGILAADCGVFQEAWGITCHLQRVPVWEDGQYDLIWHDWYIIP